MTDEQKIARNILKKAFDARKHCEGCVREHGDDQCMLCELCTVPYDYDTDNHWTPTDDFIDSIIKKIRLSEIKGAKIFEVNDGGERFRVIADNIEEIPALMVQFNDDEPEIREMAYDEILKIGAIEDTVRGWLMSEFAVKGILATTLF